MYKIEIHIGDGWGFDDEEKLVIETTDFEKAKIIQEFIEFQKDYGWAVEYQAIEEFEDEDEDEDEEYVYDEETDAWYWYDEELDTWYVYDEELDEFVEYVEEEEVEEEEVEEEDEASGVTTYVITKIDE
jgi:hypothetical protein